MRRDVGIAIIGGGAAGLAAAVAAYDAGVEDVVIFEREDATGGILKQCIHNGFGLHRFKEELTGPEYAARELAAAEMRGIEIEYEASVLSLSRDRVLSVVSPTLGMLEVHAKAVILAMGSRERTRGALRIPGARPAGVYTAGTAQHMINLEGIMPGKEIVMLGSGDIGLIVARRLAYEGAHVKMVLNRSHISSGLKRNIVQCLDDYGIPLRLLHTITSIHGTSRIEAVGVSQVDKETKAAIPGTEEIIPCDTLLLSVGLIPENELSRQAGVAIDRGSSGASVDETYQTTIPGIFSAGNVLHIHDLVDFVSEEGEGAGKAAAAFVLAGGGACGGDASERARDVGDVVASARVSAGSGVSYVVPQRVSAQAASKVLMRFRVRRVYKKASIVVLADGAEIKRFKRPVMVPAEMSEIRIDPALIAGRSAIEVRIEGEEE
ncbi:NAD(P)/FAD-dependent oxidoreductase [Slackia exigua]|uniref:NAD(P)/FAD-dependent oxidoreductase n=1 Tax=Slackia exigua TaxID=84109 RepID=UPI00210A5CF4|nr:FAD-dependent oxidoreductase [Slackia exigua]MCQ5091796.1 NAD(P)/FAD-dependent oxidoreductase [Slackia exigua]